MDNILKYDISIIDGKLNVHIYVDSSFTTSIVSFSNISIYSQDTYSSSVIYAKDCSSTKVNNITLTLSSSDLKDNDLEKTLFIIKVTMTGTVQTVYNKDSETIAWYDRKRFHDYFYNSLVELNTTNTVHHNLIDSYLRYKGLDVCIAQQDFSKACKLYNIVGKQTIESHECKTCIRK